MRNPDDFDLVAADRACAADGFNRPALRNPLCPLCGQVNQCAPAAAGRLGVDCWCSRATIAAATLARIGAADLRQACICPSCAAELSPPAADLRP